VTIWRKTIGAIGALALLAACGNDDDGDSGFAEQPVEDILAAAEADMLALTSLRMSGEITSDGEEILIDMALTTDGECAGTIGQGDASAEIIGTTEASYMKPDDAFWEMFAGPEASMISNLVGDRWVMFPADQSGFEEFCDLNELLSELGDRGDRDEGDEPTVEGTEQVDGQDAVKVSTSTNEGDPLTVWIATSSPHHILQMEVTEGDEPGLITFSEFDEGIGVEPPPEDEVIDFSEL
jgi:hypothetical protein